jgi:hypothetical protein
MKRTLDNASTVELLGVYQTLVAGLAGLERHRLELAPPCTSRISGINCCVRRVADGRRQG